MGKLIVIEGTDSSGKETQTKKLYERLSFLGKNIMKITFPNYESPACAPVKMYLAGEFGSNALEVNPYPASTMYAIDRYASYKKDWEKFYKEDGIVITDRYTQSNMIHQGSKIKNPKEKENYMKWLVDLEFNKMEIPKPDIVLFINMPFEFAQELMKNRENKITGEMKKDIHEKDKEYMKLSYINACEIAKSENWVEISCVKEGKLKTIEEISEDIFEAVKDIVFGG